jgi:hypothetical protein
MYCIYEWFFTTASEEALRGGRRSTPTVTGASNTTNLTRNPRKSCQSWFKNPGDGELA